MPSPRAPRFVWKFARASRALLVAAVGLCLAAALLTRASAGGAGDDPAPTFGARGGEKRPAVEFAPGEVLVQFRDSDDNPAKSRPQTLRLAAEGGEIEARVERVEGAEAVAPGLHLARVAPEVTLAALEALRAREDVLRAEPNYIRRPFRTPNDARYSSQWNMKNTQFAGFDIGAEAAWDVTTGSRDFVVGVIDEGIDISHEDLQANIWRNPGETVNGADDDGNGFVDDTNGWDFFHNDRTVYDGPGTTPGGFPVDSHGTHVAGIIGAQGDNSVGVAGVNWQTSIMSLKFIGPVGGRSSDLLRAYAYAKQMRELWQASGGARGANLRVLNNSYGGPGRSGIEEAAVAALSDAGILFVAASGNDRTDNDRFPQYPAGYRAANVVSVAGTSQFQSTYSMSNFGARTVHLYAPGAQVTSTTPGNTYTSFSGTSMAAPHVAGAALLLLAARPDLPMTRLRAALLYGGDTFFNFSERTITHRRLNAAKALQSAAEADSTPPGSFGTLTLATTQPTDLMARNIEWTTAPGDDAGAGATAHYEFRFSDAAPASAAEFEAARPLAAPPPNQLKTATVLLPFRHPNGFVSARALDAAGNAGPVSTVAVGAPLDKSDPYVMSQAAAEPLTTGGSPMNLRGDDLILNRSLPFRFTFFNTVYADVWVSTNGELIFNNGFSGQASDAVPLAERLPGVIRIAGLWDDLRTDRRAGDDVYVVAEDDRVVFRWQAVTFNTPLAGGGRGENPVNFEIELRRDGRIAVRYGAGNANLFPVAGLGGGEADGYLVESHTSDISTGTLKNLANAPTLFFDRRTPVPPPRPDLLVQLSASPLLVTPGQQLSLSLLAFNNDFSDDATGTTAAVELPPGLNFVSCSAPLGITCAGTPGASGRVAINLGRLRSRSQVLLSVAAQVAAPPAALLTPTASIQSRWEDSNRVNNTATVMLDVVEAASFAGVRMVSGGGGNNGSHTLAVKTDGTVYAWGANGSGQLGNSQFSVFGAGADMATLVPSLSGVAAVAAGSDYSLALKSDGTLWAWGNNQFGQTGIEHPNFGDYSRPAQIPGLAGVAAVSTHDFHTLALKSDGTVWAWGNNNFSQVAAQPSTSVPRPAQVAGLTNVVGVAAGGGHSLAVKADGTVWAWGRNQFAQCGQPTSSFTVTAPTQVPGVTDAVAVVAAEATSYVMRRDGTVWAWGMGDRGQLGDGTSSLQRVAPAPVTGLTNVVSLDAGFRHAVAMKSDGTVWAWGNNFSGQVGDGTITSRSLPTRVQNLPAAANVAAGYDYCMAILADGTLRGWGANNTGQLGDRSSGNNRLTPVPLSVVTTAAAPALSPAPGTFTSPQEVTVSNVAPGTIIRYTMGSGAEPTTDSPVLHGDKIRVEFPTNLRVRAWKDGQGPSAVAGGTYMINASSTSDFLFENPFYSVSESAGRVELTVLRTRDTSTPASVTVRTNDNNAPDTRCDARHSTAFARCDYASTAERVHFAPGETRKSVSIPVIDDAHDEINETFSVALADPVGAVIASFQGVQVAITNGADAGANPVEVNSFFVRQHYLDFLSREPEAGEPWTGVLDRCPNPTNDQSCDRVTVSGSFFRSPEFYLKGYFVYRFYKATLGELPQYDAFVTDMSRVTGRTSEETIARRDAFAADFVARHAFRQRYDQLSNAGFVHRLMQTAGVETAGGLSRDALTTQLQQGQRTRAEVVRLLAESPEVDAHEFNGAFVAMQYYGYLRRTPEQPGYNNWLNYLNANPTDFRTMVHGFANSVEYRLRFGQP